MVCQPHLLAEGVKVGYVLLVCAAKNSAYLECVAEQEGGLHADHLHIFLCLYVVALLEVDVVLLSLAHAFSSFDEGGEGFAVVHTFVEKLVCHDEHSVARQDGCVLVPLLMNSEVASPHVALVHEVVMQESEVVVCL